MFSVQATSCTIKLVVPSQSGLTQESLVELVEQQPETHWHCVVDLVPAAGAFLGVAVDCCYGAVLNRPVG
jgi:hypothetical protein